MQNNSNDDLQFLLTCLGAAAALFGLWHYLFKHIRKSRVWFFIAYAFVFAFLGLAALKTHGKILYFSHVSFLSFILASLLGGSYWLGHRRGCKDAELARERADKADDRFRECKRQMDILRLHCERLAPFLPVVEAAEALRRQIK